MTAYSHLDRPKTSSIAPNSYSLLNAKWGGTGLGTPPAMPVTYGLTTQMDGMNFTAPTQITNSSQIAAIDMAFAEWASVSNLQFTKVATGVSADITLFFDPIDGNGGTLGIAWSAFTDSGTPGVVESFIDVVIEFDPYELAGDTSEYFYLVALHEIGHALGLGHVDDPTQIMYDFYTGEQAGPGVGDVAGLQVLYGTPSGGTSGFNFGNAASENIDQSGNTSDTQIYGAAGNDTLESGAGDDTLVGGIGSDMSTGNAGRDLLFDPFGNDTLMGGAGEDNLYSPDGQNMLNGGSGNDALRGGIGNDTLIGGAGDDALIADDQTSSSLWFGDDQLEGGAGNDLLEGGSGQDVFIFAANEGNDRIGQISFHSSTGFSIFSSAPDFQVGEDKLDVTAFGFGSAGQVLGKLRSTPEGAVFEASNTSITLVGVDIDTLSIDDFIW